MNPVTLVSPDGREVVVTNPTELNDLLNGHGYKHAPKKETKKNDDK